MSNIGLFVYGTLKDGATQAAVFGRSLAGVADAIVDYRIEWITITDPEIVRKSGTQLHPVVVATDESADLVEGLVLGLSPEDITKADAYERDYVRIEVALRSGGRAQMYSPTPSRRRGES